MAAIRLGADMGKPVDDADLDALALHEVLHVFLAEALALVRDPSASDAHRASSEHRVVNTLTLLLTGRN
jgi:hypothetical protein